jgi:hypothetical protein
MHEGPRSSSASCYCYSCRSFIVLETSAVAERDLNPCCCHDCSTLCQVGGCDSGYFVFKAELFHKVVAESLEATQ